MAYPAGASKARRIALWDYVRERERERGACVCAVRFTLERLIDVHGSLALQKLSVVHQARTSADATFFRLLQQWVDLFWGRTLGADSSSSLNGSVASVKFPFWLGWYWFTVMNDIIRHQEPVRMEEWWTRRVELIMHRRWNRRRNWTNRSVFFLSFTSTHNRRLYTPVLYIVVVILINLARFKCSLNSFQPSHIFQKEVCPIVFKWAAKEIYTGRYRSDNN